MIFDLLYLLLVATLFGHGRARNPESHVIGGTEVTLEGRWPWQGSLRTPGGIHSCGCVLVHENWVLTSAQCLSGDTSGYTVEFGMLELGTGSSYDLVNVTIHPLFNNENIDGSYPYDIAVLRSTSRITGDNIQPIDLSNGANLVENDNCYITGWGRLAAGEPMPTNLHEVKVPVALNATCGALWGEAYNRDLHICVYDQQNQDKAQCDGDDGGPLSCYDGGLWRVEGIASWFMSGCNPAWPSSFSRIQAMKDFICDATNGDVATGYC